jgi:CheY-like chemotaxis protein
MANAKLKILLVDDDEIVGIYFHDIFWIYGFEDRLELAIATNLDDAERIVADATKRPDVIFLDLALPKKVGERTIIDPKYSFDFVERVKHDPKLASVKVMIFSGHSEKEYVDEAKARGADGYIHKEQSLPKDLIATIKAMYVAVGSHSQKMVNA